MIKPESLVIHPELLAIIGVEAAHVLELLQGAFDVKSDTDFLGPFALRCLVERFAIFNATAGKLRHVGRAVLGREHDSAVMDGDRQRKNPTSRLNDELCVGFYNIAASIIEND